MQKHLRAPSIHVRWVASLVSAGALAMVGCAAHDDASANTSADLSSAAASHAAAGTGTTSAVPEAAGNVIVAPSDACTAGQASAPTLTPLAGSLWPPNHKFHDISVADCVAISAGCSAVVQAEFIWASSDEPVDDLGDGHFAPDIQLDPSCGVVGLRAERQGPKDARVYKLGVRVTDATGASYESACSVVVDHDQSKAPVDSGESYRLTFDGSDGTPECGAPVVPPPATDTPPDGAPPDVTPPPTEPPGAVEPPPADEPPATEPPATEPPSYDPACPPGGTPTPAPTAGAQPDGDTFVP